MPERDDPFISELRQVVSHRIERAEALMGVGGRQQGLDLGRPAELEATTRDIAAMPKSPHKCGDCKHISAWFSATYKTCERVRPGRRTKRWDGTDGCGAFEPKE